MSPNRPGFSCKLPVSLRKTWGPLVHENMRDGCIPAAHVPLPPSTVFTPRSHWEIISLTPSPAPTHLSCDDVVDFLLHPSGDQLWAKMLQPGSISEPLANRMLDHICCRAWSLVYTTLCLGCGMLECGELWV